MKMLRGIGASPGIAVGKAFLLDSEEMPIAKKTIRENEIPQEITRFEEALTKTRA